MRKGGVNYGRNSPPFFPPSTNAPFISLVQKSISDHNVNCINIVAYGTIIALDTH